MLLDQLRKPVVNLIPDLGRHHRFERPARHLDAEVAAAPMADVDDQRAAPGLPGADQEVAPPSRSASGWPRSRSAAVGPAESARAVQGRGEMCPRLLAATAWISSTIIIRVVLSSAARNPSRAGCRATPASSRRYAAAAHRCARARPASCRRSAPGSDFDVGKALRL